MNTNKVTYPKTGYFSKIVLDYLSKDEKVAPLYGNFPNIKGFKKQFLSKGKLFSTQTRKTLVTSLKKQYKNTNTSTATLNNIDLLEKENTFTITTGHQLNLFTGPLYFLYKIMTTINLCERLKKEFPKQNFVPIYWMATEDHDFEEIHYFNFKNKKISWNKNSKGAVGRLATHGLAEVCNEMELLFGIGKNAKKLIALFKKSYLNNHNLSDATRFLTNELFKEYGLVVLDADDNMLKKQFIPFVKDELISQTAHDEVIKTNKELNKNYKIQVNPRKINLFYLNDNLRERIIFNNNKYQINNTEIEFSKTAILQELKKHPERFSPNVIMRPLYQEVILPNLCYIGGGGEIAYWLELKSYFEKVGVVFPILLLRNSVLLINGKQHRKLDKLGITKDELFLKQNDLLNKKITELSNLNLDFAKQKDFLQKQFEYLKKIAKQTDKSFIGAVKAQEKKQLNGLTNLEKRLLKAEKRKLKEIANRIILVQDQLFPNQNLQERALNFSELYLEYGDTLIPTLKKHLKPLDLEFTILSL